MKVDNIEDCFKFRLLRKIEPNSEKSKRSMELAEQEAVEAESAMKFPILKYVILSSYFAMFHAARAVLYRDGIQEKSHYAIFVYLKEKYSKKVHLSVLNLLNVHRIERHEAMYGLDYKPDKEEADRAIKDAKLFIKEMGLLLKEGK